MKTLIILLVFVCLNTETKTVYSYSIELSVEKNGTAVVHADTDNDGKKDFNFLISKKELKDILKKRGLLFSDMQFYSIKILDGDCFFVFESFKTKKK